MVYTPSLGTVVFGVLYLIRMHSGEVREVLDPFSSS